MVSTILLIGGYFAIIVGCTILIRLCGLLYLLRSRRHGIDFNLGSSREQFRGHPVTHLGHDDPTGEEIPLLQRSDGDRAARQRPKKRAAVTFSDSS